VKKALFILLIGSFCVAAVVGPVWYVKGLFMIVDKPESVTSFGSGDDLLHVIPEKALEGALIVDAKGKRHYVLSEEQLRLIGPKFLAKLAGEE